MTQKSITNVYLSDVCLECNGERVVVRGEYDNEEIVDCVCVKEEKAQKEADGREN